MTSGTHEQGRPPLVAVIGTGTMGAAMARRLLGAHMDVHVWARHAASTTALVDLGAASFERAPDAVRDVDVVITMLPTPDATADFMVHAKTLEAMKPGSIWVQMATLGVEATEELATETRNRRPDVAFIDAPVSGSREPAESGQLLILA